ncbi:MAG: chitobiase/beta-hexosaminidase C-terminal domain-containing protein [Spirochaetes bacterium]|nr:chitobiase/beta-hexosaminidase C-terminal domain-containing protein [Spirochaetota bacterium]
MKRTIIKMLMLFILISLTYCSGGGGSEPTATNTKPAEPDAVIIAESDSQLALNWTSVRGATAYEVWYSLTDKTIDALKDGGDIAGTSHIIFGLINGTTYYIWLKAKNSIGISDFGNMAAGIPFNPFIPPNAPLRPSVTALNGNLNVTWAYVHGATSYEVWCNTTDDNTSAELIANDNNNADNTCIINSFNNNTLEKRKIYYAWVKAKNTIGDSNFSESNSGVIPEQVAPVQFSIQPGLYADNQNVALSCATPGAKIYYTTNGNNPDLDNMLLTGTMEYQNPIDTPIGEITIKAIAAGDGDYWLNSEPVSGRFRITGWAYVGTQRFLERDKNDIRYVNSTDICISNGSPFIAYNERLNSNTSVPQVSVMKFDGVNWVYAGQRGLGSSTGKGYASSDYLIADSNGTIYVAYNETYDTSNANHEANIIVKKYNAGNDSWVQIGNAIHLSAEETALRFYNSFSINVDANNSLYCTYIKAENDGKIKNVYVSIFDGNDWTAYNGGIVYTGNTVVCTYGNASGQDTDFSAVICTPKIAFNGATPYVVFKEAVDETTGWAAWERVLQFRIKCRYYDVANAQWADTANNGIAEDNTWSAADYSAKIYNNNLFIAYADIDSFRPVFNADNDPEATVARLNISASAAGANWSSVGNERFSEELANGDRIKMDITDEGRLVVAVDAFYPCVYHFDNNAWHPYGVLEFNDDSTKDICLVVDGKKPYVFFIDGNNYGLSVMTSTVEFVNIAVPW